MARFLDQRLRLRHLRLVDAVATQRSGLRAARALSISQPALSKALHEVEEIFGARLFERHARGMQATAAGEVVIRYARQILGDIHRMEDDIDGLASERSGAVAVGALPGAAAGLLPVVLAKARKLHPRLKIRIVQGRTEDLLPMMTAGELDMVIGRLYPPRVPDGIKRERLYEEPLAAIARASHPIFRKARPRLADLAAYEFILPTFSQRVGQEIEHVLVDAGLPASPETLRSTSISFIREMLHATDMVTVAARVLLAGDLARGSLRLIPVRLPELDRPAGLMTRHDRPLSRPAEALAALVRASIAEAAAAGVLSLGENGYTSRSKIDTTPAPVAF